MGLFKTLATALGFVRVKARILVIGLDNSGKTTLINHLKPKKANVSEVVPTVGFQVEEFSKHKLQFTVFDMSGQGRYRSLWEEYYSNVHAVVFVVDCTDQVRLVVAKDEIETLLKHPDVGGSDIPLLIYANKMDLPSALSPVEVVQLLGLESITENPWHVVGSNAVSGEGVDEGVAWLAESVRANQRRLRSK